MPRGSASILSAILRRHPANHRVYIIGTLCIAITIAAACLSVGLLRRDQIKHQMSDANDLAINIPDAVNVISPNALGEFRVVTGPMKAEYGRNSGAVIESTIKSGSNSFHGEATEIFRNKVLNSNNFFLNEVGTPKPKYNLKRFRCERGRADY